MKSERERAGGEIPRKVWRFAPPKSASMRINPDTQFGKTDTDVGGDKTLPASSLATSDGPDHLPMAGLSLPHPLNLFLISPLPL